MGNTTSLQALMARYEDAVIDAMAKGNALLASVGKSPMEVLRASEAAEEAARHRDEVARQLTVARRMSGLSD